MSEVLLTRLRLLDALGRLGDELGRQSVTADVHLVGGAVLIIEHDLREGTRDVDAARLPPHRTVIAAVAVVAEQMGLPSTWLNEQASVFAPRQADWRRSDIFDHPNLRLYGIEATQLLAMKALAGRPTDLEDLVFLIDHTDSGSVAGVLDLVERHFPGEDLGPRQLAVISSAVDAVTG